MTSPLLKQFEEYTPYLKQKTVQALASLVLEGMYPDAAMMQALVLRDTGKITGEDFLNRTISRAREEEKGTKDISLKATNL